MKLDSTLEILFEGKLLEILEMRQNLNLIISFDKEIMKLEKRIIYDQDVIRLIRNNYRLFLIKLASFSKALLESGGLFGVMQSNIGLFNKILKDSFSKNTLVINFVDGMEKNPFQNILFKIFEIKKN